MRLPIDHWYLVLDSRQVKPGKLTGVTRLGEQLLFYRRLDGAPVCLMDLCPHRGAAISIGELNGECVVCPFHGFEFDPSGRCTLIPANGAAAAVPKAMRVRSFPLVEKHGYIWLWWGEPREQYPPLPWFDDLEDGFSYASDRLLWNVHYTRAVENQLDVFHLPFVHRTTIGRGNRTITDGPVVRLDGPCMDIWLSVRAEDGRPAVKPDQMPEPQGNPLLKFIFPHIWMNRLGDDLRITLAFVPVDKKHTLFYLRYYQRFVRVPLLRDLFNWGNKLGSRVIINQDLRVVQSQRPLQSQLRMDEKPIPADRPIILFRQYNEEHF